MVEENTINLDDLKRANMLQRQTMAYGSENGLVDITLGLLALAYGFARYFDTGGLYAMKNITLVAGIVVSAMLLITFFTLERRRTEARGEMKSKFPVAGFVIGNAIVLGIIFLTPVRDSIYPVGLLLLSLYYFVFIGVAARVNRYNLYALWSLIAFGIVVLLIGPSEKGFAGDRLINYLSIFSPVPIVYGFVLFLKYLKNNTLFTSNSIERTE